MGIFDFVEEAGAKMNGTDEFRAEQITKQVSSSGLGISNFKVDVNTTSATVYGEAESFEVKEKIVLMVGNNNGISKVDDNISVAEENEETAESQFYTVQKGDTLGKIAKQFYNNAGKYPAIVEANQPMIKNADLIYVGQVLRIPPVD